VDITLVCGDLGVDPGPEFDSRLQDRWPGEIRCPGVNAGKKQRYEKDFSQAVQFPV
jgi:hypothetical protein